MKRPVYTIAAALILQVSLAQNYYAPTKQPPITIPSADLDQAGRYAQGGLFFLAFGGIVYLCGQHTEYNPKELRTTGVVIAVAGGLPLFYLSTARLRRYARSHGSPPPL